MMENKINRSIELNQLICILKQCKSEGLYHYLDIRCGKLYRFSNHDAEMDESGFLNEILYNEENRFIFLPVTCPMDEYTDLCCFIEEIDNQPLHDRLKRCTKGKGAVRRTKRELRRLHLTPQWEWYRDRFYYRLAMEWAMENGVELIGPVSDNPEEENDIECISQNF